MTEQGKPLLAVDVDGVISLFGFPEVREPAPALFEVIDGRVHCISLAAGAHLRQLEAEFEPIWVTGWEGRANRLSALLDLPEYPYLAFGSAARFGTADWKLDPLGEYARGRPLAWIDDCFDARCYAWADAREEPTLLVPTEPHLGLEDTHVDCLTAWARGLPARA